MKPVINQSADLRSAFLLNAKAKSVGGGLLNKLIEMVPTGDLYLSHSLSDSQRYLRTIVDKGYQRIFSGGGDGTLMNTLSTIAQLTSGSSNSPQVGVLKLGTGNAVATVLGAKRPLVDVNHILSGGRTEARSLHMIRCEDGNLAPFAGIGLDGEIINDYCDLKSVTTSPLGQRLVRTALGYVWAGLTRTAVRHLHRSQPMVRITSKTPSVKMATIDGADTRIEMPSGSVLFEGHASMISVGSIPNFGYGFKMFPYLGNDSQPRMQLRICTAGVWPIVSNLPSLWNGTYRGAYVYDFLVDQVNIESEESLPYQVAGDARGYRKEISFTLAKDCMKAVELDKNRIPLRRGVMALLPAPVAAR